MPMTIIRTESKTVNVDDGIEVCEFQLAWAVAVTVPNNAVV